MSNVLLISVRFVPNNKVFNTKPSIIELVIFWRRSCIPALTGVWNIKHEPLLQDSSMYISALRLKVPNLLCNRGSQVRKRLETNAISICYSDGSVVKWMQLAGAEFLRSSRESTGLFEATEGNEFICFIWRYLQMGGKKIRIAGHQSPAKQDILSTVQGSR